MVAAWVYGLGAGILTVVGEGLLVLLLLRLRAAAVHLDDPRPARFLLIGAVLAGISALGRSARYVAGGVGFLDAFLFLLLGVVGYALAWRATTQLPGTSLGSPAGSAILVGTAFASAILLVGSSGFLLGVQLFLGLGLGFLGATLAVAGWSVRAAGVAGIVPSLAVLGGYLMVVGAWTRALFLLAGASGDPTVGPAGRFVQATLTLTAILLAAPALSSRGRILGIRTAPDGPAPSGTP